MKYYYSYVFLSKKDSNLYFGFTEYLKSRIEWHNNDKVESTKQLNSYSIGQVGTVYVKSMENLKDNT
jgi:predicted GIY-YIG superfamily endonuclease